VVSFKDQQIPTAPPRGLAQQLVSLPILVRYTTPLHVTRRRYRHLYPQTVANAVKRVFG
jgi:hypothetical protein